MSPTATTAGSVASRPAVEVAGSPLAAVAVAALRTTTVDTDVAGPDSCRLVFDDPGHTLLSDSGVDLASPLVVHAGRVGDDGGEPLFDGLVYAIGFEHDDRGSFTVLTGYDRSYALHSGRRTATYQDVTDADLARRIADELGLTPEVESSPVVHEHVSQLNETHFDFLSRRAREIGYEFRVVRTTLVFGPATSAGDAPAPGDFGATERLQLVPGGNLQRLSVRVSGAQQAKEVVVRRWDVGDKEVVTTTASPATRSSSLVDTPQSVADAFGAQPLTVTSLPLGQQAEADAAAKATSDLVGGSAVHAEGTAFGDPRLCAGAAVSLGGTGGRFDGKVTVTRARHVWDGAGYRTTFVASGSHDRSLLGLVTGAGGAPVGRATPPTIGGVVQAVVTDVDDPLELGRVRLRFPWLDDQYESGWARVAHPGAGRDRGFVSLPEVDDEVVVAFEQGDTRQAVVLGGLFNGKDTPPVDGAPRSGEVPKRLWRSRSGHQVVMDDTSGEEKVEITTAGGKVVLVLSDTGKGAELTVEGPVKVKGTQDVEITSDANVVLKAARNATVEAGGSLTLKASGDVTVSGAVIKLN